MSRYYNVGFFRKNLNINIKNKLTNMRIYVYTISLYLFCIGVSFANTTNNNKEQMKTFIPLGHSQQPQKVIEIKNWKTNPKFSVFSLKKLVALEAETSGTISVFSPKKAVNLKKCTFIIIKDWNVISGLAPISNPDTYDKIYALWNYDFIFSQYVQKKHSLYKKDKIDYIYKNNKIWKYCDLNP